MAEASDKITLARGQLARVQVASLDPVDWSDVALYGLYALENAVVAAAEILGIPWTRSHPSKVDVARKLHEQHGLPDISDLLTELNARRKSEAYGEEPVSTSQTPELVATRIEEFIEAVAAVIATRP